MEDDGDGSERKWPGSTDGCPAQVYSKAQWTQAQELLRAVAGARREVRASALPGRIWQLGGAWAHRKETG